MFYLGTWEIGALPFSEITKVLKFSLNLGISAYDTAMIYGNGKVEKALGEMDTNDLCIVTKIPGCKKPEINEQIPVKIIYPFNYVKEQITLSLKRLNRKKVSSLLLHNWCYSWEDKYLNQSIDLIDMLKEMNIADKIGISLPNNYQGQLHNLDLFKLIDIVESPYNSNNHYIKDFLSFYTDTSKEIIIRSMLKGENIEPEKISSVLKQRLLFCKNNNF